MISFIICLALLIGGYFVYGKVVENTFAPDDRVNDILANGQSAAIYDVCIKTMGGVGVALAMIVLWTASMYLFREKKNYWITAVPATFMSAVVFLGIFIHATKKPMKAQA